MSVNRFFVSASDVEGDRVRLSPEQAHQIHHVLRLKSGNPIVVLDDTGIEYDVQLTAVELRETVGRITGSRPARGEPAARVALFQSMLAREKFEWVLQKGTEVGVARFVPILTERSIVRARMIEEKKLERWRRIVVEAAEQSHRGRIPTLDQLTAFDRAISVLSEFDRCFIAAPSRGGATLRGVLHDAAGRAVSVALMVGAEGGFSEEELDTACRGGAVPINLGPRILRTETCAVVASALILHELGEMGP